MPVNLTRLFIFIFSRIFAFMQYHVFSHPYILIEDSTGRHRPFHREYKRDSKDTMIPEINLSQQTLPKKQRSVKKPGLCELCVIKYADYDQHITTEKHLKAEDRVEYGELEIIAESLRVKGERRKPRKRLFI
ncbi:hypothetical protein NEIG_00349 [Nematocida sp. ERTm5]|nr:hypothetical protein NEIRO02_1888 [Nematocida sp. AWRm79]KAI5184859.1 hypothetical protein NEIRO03_1864 [Nematocida sp. AWRm78]OAG30865.1 hypothetical protein NEIG_00349 [Nematocida sp. ERTm5]